MRILLLALTNVAAFKRRYLGLALLLLVGVGVSLPLLSVSSQADDAARTRVQEGVALRSIEVLPRTDTAEGAKLTPAKIASITGTAGVDQVEPTLQATFGIKSRTIEGALLHGTKLRPSLTPPLTGSSRPGVFPLKAGEVVLPSTAQGMDLKSLLGQKVTVSYQQTIGSNSGRGATADVAVVGLYDPSWQLEGADAAFVADPTLLAWAASIAGLPEDQLLSTVGYDKATVVTDRSDQVATVLRSLQGEGLEATSLEQQLTELPSVLKLIHTLSRVFVIIIAVFIMLASATLTSSLTRQRTREIGILKSVGYRTAAILRMLLSELFLVGLVFSILGIALGAVISSVAAGYLDSYPDLAAYVDARQMPSPSVFALLILLPVAAVVLGGLRSAIRGAALQPSAALKDW